MKKMAIWSGADSRFTPGADS